MEQTTSTDSPTSQRPKRAQVKNACTNCQRACKKCDPFRPCQRCIKYELTDTCVNSKRKPRKKGIKRGPYKKRKKNPTEESSTSTTPIQGTSKRKPRTPLPSILGPGAINILQSDPSDSDEYETTPDIESGSDTPLANQPLVRSEGPLSAGLARAFGELATSRYNIGSSTLRLPPIVTTSMHHARPVGSPPSTSSLSILTHVALGHSNRRPQGDLPEVLHPPLPRPEDMEDLPTSRDQRPQEQEEQTRSEGDEDVQGLGDRFRNLKLDSKDQEMSNKT